MSEELVIPIQIKPPHRFFLSIATMLAYLGILSVDQAARWYAKRYRWKVGDGPWERLPID